MISETREQIAERLNNAKAQKQAEMDARLDPWRKAADERRAAEQQRRQEEAQQRQEKLQAAQTEAFDRQHKTSAWLTYLRTGGSREQFEKAWPDMRERLRAELIIKDADRQPKRNILT